MSEQRSGVSEQRSGVSGSTLRRVGATLRRVGVNAPACRGLDPPNARARVVSPCPVTGHRHRTPDTVTLANERRSPPRGAAPLPPAGGGAFTRSSPEGSPRMMGSSGGNETIREPHPIKGTPTQPPTALPGLRAAGSLRRPLTGKSGRRKWKNDKPRSARRRAGLGCQRRALPIKLQPPSIWGDRPASNRHSLRSREIIKSILPSRTAFVKENLAVIVRFS